MHLSPTFGVTLFKFHQDLWHQKTSPWAIMFSSLDTRRQHIPR